MKTETKLAPGHNPDRLTVKQVGRGWRLLSHAEQAHLYEENRIQKHLSCWCSGLQFWQGPAHKFYGNAPSNTYRTRKPAGYFLPKTPQLSPKQEKQRAELLARPELVHRLQTFAKRICWHSKIILDAKQQQSLHELLTEAATSLTQ